jgi:hypothetical protein
VAVTVAFYLFVAMAGTVEKKSAAAAAALLWAPNFIALGAFALALHRSEGGRTFRGKGPSPPAGEAAA